KMFGREASQRHGQVEPQSDVASAMILELVELPVGFVTSLAGEDFQVLESRRINRAEAIRAINSLGGGDQPFARDHRFRQVVAESVEGAGLDEWCVHTIGNIGGRGLRIDSPFFRGKTASMYSATCSDDSKNLSYTQSSSYSQSLVEYARQISGRVS